MIVNPSKILPEGEHQGQVFDQPGYDKALKESGYTAREAQDYWAKYPQGKPMTPSISISLNKNTGNIKISAPKEVYESEAFKQVFKDNDLKALSRAYKTNPGVEFETSEGKMVGIEDLVKMLDEDAKKYAENLANEAAAKSLLQSVLGDKIGDVSNDNLIIMGTSGDLENSKEENAVIAIPKTISEMFPALTKLESFSSDSVKQGDFFENFYNLSKTDREDLVRLRKTLDAYFENGDYSDLDEFSRMYALRDFIYTYEPEAGFWEKEGLKWEPAIEGAARATAGFTAGIMSIVQGASDLLVNAMEGSTALLARLVGEEYTAKKPSEVDFDLINTGIGAVFGTEDLNEELANQYKERSEYYYALNRSSATVFALSYLATSVAENILAGRAIGNIIGNYASAVAVSRGYDLAAEANGAGMIVTESGQALTGWSATMASITGTPTPSLWQTIKALSSVDTTKIFAGAQAVITAAATIPGAAATTELTRVASDALRILKNGKFVATGANFLAQVTIDTTLANPTAMRRIISGDASDEDKQVYLREMAWNAAGYGAGILLSKAASSFAKTKAGEAVNAWATQKMASAKTTFYDMTDSIKSKVWGNWMDNISNAGKKQVARYNEIINEANRQIANATADLGSTAYAASQTQAVKDARMRAIAAQNEIDNQEAGVRHYMNLYMGGGVKNSAATYYPALSDALRNATEKETELNRMLDKLGVKTNAKPTALVNGTSTNLGVPQDVVNYIADRYSKDYLIRKKLTDGVLTSNEEKGLEIANRRLIAFENSRPPELTLFLNREYYPALKRAYQQINIHRDEAHIESKANRKGLIESKLFGKKGQEWIHMQAITDFQKDAVDNTNRLSSQLSGFAKVEDIPDYYHYSWGSEKDYVHPQLALQNYLWQTAVAENARNSWQNFSPIYKEKTNLLVSGEEGEAAQTYKNLKKKLDKTVKTGLNSITDDLKVDDAIYNVVQDLANVKTFEKAQKKVKKVQEAAVDIATKDLRVTQKDKLAAVMSMPDDAISDILGDESMSNIGLSEESWDKLVQGSNKKIKDGVKELFNEHRQLTGYTEDTSRTTSMDQVLDGKMSFDEYLKTQRNLLWKSFKDSNRGVETFYKTDAVTGQIEERIGVSENGSLYRRLYEEYGGKPTKALFNEALDDVLANGEKSIYYNDFREFDSYGERAIFDFNQGNDNIDDILELREFVETEAPFELNNTLSEKHYPKGLAWTDYQETLKFHPEINSEIDRLRVQNEKRYWDNDIVTKTAINQKRAQLMFEAGDAMDEAARQLNLPTTNDRMEAILSARKAVDGFKEYILGDAASKEVIDAIAFSVAPDNLETARDYVTLKVLSNNKSDLEDALKKLLNKEKFSGVLKKKWPGSIKKHENALVKFVTDEIEKELDDSRNLLKAAGETIIDEDDVMSEIKNLVKEIDELSGDETVVSVYNDAGQLELYRTDPVLASLYNYRPITPPSKAELVFGNSVFRTMNRVARFFQTTVNPKSFKNQFFRDFGNGYFGVGAYLGMGMMSKDLQTVYGGALADKLLIDMKATSPSTYDFLAKQAEDTGQDIKGLVVNRYLSFGRITSPAETPTSFYREPFDRGEGFAASLKKTKGKLAEFGNKLLEKAEALNQAREIYLRNSTYAKGLQDGLDNGMTVKEAQQMAQFFQRNGTTNFGRQLYHFRALQKTVNYFGAGVNGFTSFWRLFSLDPVGVATRIFSGLVVPTIFTTAIILSDEKNREKYIHLPEYYKKEQFIFMVNGQFYAIPIPQELDAFVAPVRQAVESLYDSNRNSFEELLLSDFLNIGPVEFGSIMMLDRDRLINESPTFLDRAGALGLDLIDQTMPNAIKLGVQTVTGIDTYTGDRIDNSYYMIDDDGNRTLVGGTTSKFALQVARATGASPSIIAHVTESLVGQVGEDILDVVFGGENVSTLVENTITGLTSLERANYNLVRAEWNSTISELWAEKERIYLPAYVDYSESIYKESDPNEKKKLQNKRQDAIQPFLDKVKMAVGNLKESYGGSYDRFRFASVVSLLTFDTGTTTANTSEAILNKKSSDEDNRNNAYLWMVANGLNASEDRSILGYLTKNSNGETVIKYNTPTGILAMRDALYGAGDRDVAEIRILLDSAKIKRSDKFGDDYNAAKAQGKTALKQYKASWNAKVVKILAPYIQERGVSSVLNNVTTRDLLNDYLFIDNPYQVKQYLTKIFGGE